MDFLPNILTAELQLLPEIGLNVEGRHKGVLTFDAGELDIPVQRAGSGCHGLIDTAQ